ncbi:hypothetical protein GTW63_06010 [Streptomyces sp. SID6137]|nr:hypothetical protein [Streptomyces sp. SID6137]
MPRRTVGGPRAMRAQIDHLVEIGRLPQVTVRLPPFAHGPHPAMPVAAYHLFRFRARELPDIVYADGLLGAVHLDKPEHVEPCREALNHLATQAPPATRTEPLLGAIRAESQG